MRTRPWTDADLTRAVAESINWAQVARAVGLKADGGGSYARIRAVAADLGLDTSHFRGRAWNKGLGKGRDMQSQRDAKARWYYANKQVYLDRNQRRAEERREKLRQLKKVPCTDCGRRFPTVAMDFDHRDGEVKLGNVSTAAGMSWSWAKIEAEVAKCDVVCAVCHRIRTARRGGWFLNDNGE